MRTSFRALGLLAPAIALQHGATFRHAPHSERRHHLTYSTRGSLSEFRRFYREGDLLGEGSFAIVKKGTDLQTRESVAVKEIDKERSNELAIENEILVMEKLGKHENIVALRGVFESATAVYVVQDLAEGGELFDVVVKRGELSERMASKYFADAGAWGAWGAH
jgi:serine/threonine protein kinase